jgi:hypothetical protein
MLIAVVQARHQRTPVQDGPVPAAPRDAHELQRIGRDPGRIGLDALVVDAGIGEQQSHLEVHELVQPVGVAGLHPVPRDDKHVVAQATAVEIGQHRQRVRPDSRQERVRRTVEKLNRGEVRLKVAMADQPLHRLGVGHRGARLALIP